MNYKAFLLILGLSVGWAGGTPQSARAELPQIIKTVGDVFLKGSIDGKSMFMVLGMADAVDISGDIAKWAVDPEDFVDLARQIYNEQHKNDLVDRLDWGVKATKAYAPKILSEPWRSLSEIPNAYQVNLDRAKDAYYRSDNAAVGVVKYAAWAAVANIEGAWYLVIEAPVEFIVYSAATLGAVPASLLLEGLVVAWDAGAIVLKMAAGAIALVVVNTYGLISSTTATLLTLTAASGVAVYRGSKWLVYDLPRKALFYPISEMVDTKLGVDEQERVAQATLEVLAKTTHLTTPRLNPSLSKYGSTIEVYVQAADGKEIKLANVKVYIKKKSVRVAVELTRTYLKARIAAAPDLSPDEIKKRLKEETAAILSEIQAAINPPVPAPVVPEPAPQPAPVTPPAA